MILERSHYAAAALAELPGVSVRCPGFFKEFVVDFDGTGRSVAEVNARAARARHLRRRGPLGPHPQLGQSALYCVTEVHTRDDVDRLVDAMKEVLAMTGLRATTRPSGTSRS